MIMYSYAKKRDFSRGSKTELSGELDFLVSKALSLQAENNMYLSEIYNSSEECLAKVNSEGILYRYIYGDLKTDLFSALKECCVECSMISRATIRLQNVDGKNCFSISAQNLLYDIEKCKEYDHLVDALLNICSTYFIQGIDDVIFRIANLKPNYNLCFFKRNNESKDYRLTVNMN